MRNLRRRIETLERSKLAKLADYQTIADRTMTWLWPNDVEALIAAYGAERAGRRLTERETAAKRTYSEALQRECRWAGLPPIMEADFRSVIVHGITHVLACRICSEDLEFCRRGVCATQQGREASDRELAALETYRSEMERISLIAGFASVAELYAVRSPTEDL
jgi:hypothetical protein